MPSLKVESAHPPPLDGASVVCGALVGAALGVDVCVGATVGVGDGVGVGVGVGSVGVGEGVGDGDDDVAGVGVDATSTLYGALVAAGCFFTIMPWHIFAVTACISRAPA